MKRIATIFSSHGAFHENPILFYSCNIQHVLLHTPRPKASSIFCHRLIERDKHKARRFIIQACHSLHCMFSALYLRNSHHRVFWRTCLIVRLIDRTNNEAPQIACSRRVMIWMNGLFLTTASTLATVASWPE